MQDYIIGGVVGLLAGAGGLFALLKLSGNNLLAAARQQAEQAKAQALKEAETRGKEIELKIKQEQLTVREQAEKDLESQRRKFNDLENRLTKREETLDRKLDTLGSKEKNLETREHQLIVKEKNLAAVDEELRANLAEQKQRLLNITGMSVDQAKAQLLQAIEDDCKQDAGEIIKRHVEQATEEGKEKARVIILNAIQRYAAEQTSDHTVSMVEIPDDAMKGRVIGREGRNIRSFEKTTGVDVIIDDTPGVVVVSCFDPVRREIARQSLEKLVQDGRIHPARIEEVVALTTKEMEENLVKIGKDASQQLHFLNLAKPILPMLGRLSYRTSYGQNVLKHSQEVAYLAQMMADELGLDGELARRAGLLHDIGKAMDHEQEGGHPLIGYEFLKKLGEPEAVLNACAGHHGDVPASTPYTPLIMAADAISGSRPGARRESLEKYVKRLKDLEDLASGFDGVRQAYAIQAGREVRVIVDARAVDDKATAKIARDISKKIETDLTYPGEIKVTVLREVRNVEYAR
jgi:ribonucrease Y